MSKIKQISHLTCKLKFLECPGVHTVSVRTIITAWLSDRKIFYRICSYNILELMQRVILALPLKTYGDNASIVVKKGPLLVTGLFIQNRSHILFPLHIAIKNCYIWFTQIDNEFNSNVNLNVHVTSD
jgi:hypothetical protein